MLAARSAKGRVGQGSACRVSCTRRGIFRSSSGECQLTATPVLETVTPSTFPSWSPSASPDPSFDDSHNRFPPSLPSRSTSPSCRCPRSLARRRQSETKLVPFPQTSVRCARYPEAPQSQESERFRTTVRPGSVRAAGRRYPWASPECRRTPRTPRRPKRCEKSRRSCQAGTRMVGVSSAAFGCTGVGMRAGRDSLDTLDCCNKR